MSSPTQGASTSSSQVHVDWSAVSTSPANGGSTITSYNLQWDAGSSGTTWTDLIGVSPETTVTTYTVTSGIVSGTTYQFKVRAKNYWGWGDFSSTVSVLAASAPSQMAAATTSIDASTGGVKIEWVEPSSNGAPIAAYLIEIQDVTTAWRTETSNCDGSNPSILTNKYCIIPMATLSAPPFLLTFDSLISVRVSAQNSVNWSTVSPVNVAGARIR